MFLPDLNARVKRYSFLSISFCFISTELVEILTILISEKITSPCLAVTPLIVTRLEWLEIQIDDNFKSSTGLNSVLFVAEKKAGLVGSFDSAQDILPCSKVNRKTIIILKSKPVLLKTQGVYKECRFSNGVLFNLIIYAVPVKTPGQ